MPKAVEAVYENGVLRLTKPVKLPKRRKILVYIEEKRFSELIDELELEAREDLDKTLEKTRRKRSKQHAHPRLEEIKLGE
ncbi:antitoxin AF2212-like protein [Palaeococcus sp. (in: euryarchaeotes)]